MQITINDKTLEVKADESLLEIARREGFEIPSLCHSKEAKHKSSCMVCAVKDVTRGQIIPSCTSKPTEGMLIDTQSEEVKQVRTMSLELLLSDHRADCEAPCSMVCPALLDIERMLDYYDKGQKKEALGLVKHAFDLPKLACEDCKAPCEKACRRGNVDAPVAIREIIKELASTLDATAIPEIKNMEINKKLFQSRLGRFSDSEKRRLKETVSTPSNCLHCACAGKSGCQLRTHATSHQIKRPGFDIGTELQVMSKIQVNETMYFEQAKCIRCGLCVYNSDNGFTFKNRGFGMEVHLPEENRENIPVELATLCPTGAIYVVEN
ncbi:MULTISPECIES: 2Fe-2S iron-sulfur cluster-binding protein [unclassified Saccharicrinis]|uniref:2Fe-2S iron-sulfur cluster-binding protein n=1 Tax=unclassified Saccharicrinis TaxID=2646859 RepID=UPI003D34E7E8